MASAELREPTYRVVFKAWGRTVPGEDEDARVRRITREAHFRREYRRLESQARGWSYVEAGEATRTLMELWDGSGMCELEPLEQCAAAAGRAERQFRKIIAEFKRHELALRLVREGIVELRAIG